MNELKKVQYYLALISKEILTHAQMDLEDIMLSETS